MNSSSRRSMPELSSADCHPVDGSWLKPGRSRLQPTGGTGTAASPVIQERRPEKSFSQLSARVSEPVLDSSPVDDVPDRLEVRRALVLVLEVVSVLPEDRKSTRLNSSH